MDSTAVYDSGNASDSEVWSSSEGEEQVIEISSHSRILISPRKARSSAWGEKSQRSGRRRVSTGKKRSTRVLQNASVVGSPHSQTSRHSGHAKRLVKSYWPGSPRTTPSDNQPATSNNKQHSESSESDGDIASDQEEEDLSSDSCGSLEDAESPVHRRVPRTKHGVNKTTKSAFKYTAATSLNDSMQSLDSPTTPGKEMEELKATLKKLARHDDSGENPISQKVPDISSATALHEYLTAATALGGVNALEKTRPVEYPGLLKTRHASFLPPRKSPSISTGSAKPRSKSRHETADDPRIRRGSTADKLNRMLDSPVEAGNDRLSFNKKLFGKPPPPFEGPGKYVPGLAFPVPASSNSRAGSGGVGGGAQGSRAMLSALKALQNKISRLEEERGALRQELSEAKLSARKREAELASSEKKFAYELGQTKESARAAYDALRCDREELKLQLVKSEERRKATQVELQHFQELTKTFSAKADDLQAQLQISESHRTRLKAEMKESESEHKRLVNELQTELTQVRQEQQDAAERIELLETQVERESSNHAESRERLKDSEQTVASISQLNEKLVAKVMEATETANQAIKRNKKLQQQIRPSTLLKPTAASRASAAAVNEAASRRAGSSAVAQGNSSARTLKKKKTSSGTVSGTQSAAKKTKKAKAVNNMTLLREANLGKEIPFLLGHSVQPSFSVIGNVQDALRRCDTTYVMPTLLGGAPTTPGSTSSHRNTTKKTQSTTHTDVEATNPEEGEEEESAQQLPRSASPPSDEPPLSTTPKANTGGHRRSTKHKPPAIKVPTASPKSYASPMQSQIMEDLAAAVDAAEKEFKSLNKRYKDLVAQMEANNRRGAPGSESAKGNNSSAQLSQALGPLLDDLEAKAKQLNLLKQVYQQASNSTINPPRHVVLSPEAIRRKTASLRLLNEFRQLESDSKNKGSGRSASPSTMGFFH